jgi:hypothetical protein
MGVTISYHGSLADLDRLVDFEDRAIDLALELGGQARVWRTTGDDDPSRVVRGVLLNLFPGPETFSLLISPEGWLIGLADIEDAEKGKLAEPPYCFVKTQFGPLEGHAALIEMLSMLKKEFLPDLEVSDEGGYWESRNLELLTRNFRQVQAAIDGLVKNFELYGLSAEAAEDRDILIKRIERIAEVVHRTLARPSEHPPVRFAEEDDSEDFLDDLADDESGEESESLWDDSFKENRRRQERIHRAIEEHLTEGKDPEEAFEAAMLEETAAGLPEEEDDSVDSPRNWLAELEMELEVDDPWKESLWETDSDAADIFSDGDDFEKQMHPLQRRAMDLVRRTYDLAESKKQLLGAAGGQIEALLQGVGDMMGGLAQALGPDDMPSMRGLSIVQLKRALRGAAFALGSLFPLKSAGILDQSTFKELHDAIEQLQTDIFAELTRFRRHGVE